MMFLCLVMLCDDESSVKHVLVCGFRLFHDMFLVFIKSNT